MQGFGDYYTVHQSAIRMSNTVHVQGQWRQMVEQQRQSKEQMAKQEEQSNDQISLLKQFLERR